MRNRDGDAGEAGVPLRLGGSLGLCRHSERLEERGGEKEKFTGEVFSLSPLAL